MPGETRIRLFLFIEDLEDLFWGGWAPPLELAYYSMLGKPIAPVIFPVGHWEPEEIDPRVSGLFHYSAWLVVLRYEGLLALLEEDLKLPRPF